MASPIPGAVTPMQQKPMTGGGQPLPAAQGPGTAPPWLRGTGGVSPPPSRPTPQAPPAWGSGNAISDPPGAFGFPRAAPSGPSAGGLASLGSMTAQSSAPGGVSPPPPMPTGPAGKSWDGFTKVSGKGSQTFDFDWDPDNPLVGGDALGGMFSSSYGAGGRASDLLKMTLKDANGNVVSNNGGGTGMLGTLTSKLGKGKYSMQVDPTDTEKEWVLSGNKRGQSYFDNGGQVSGTSNYVQDRSGGPDPFASAGGRDASAAAWDAGAESRFADQNALNEGYGGAATNPNFQGGGKGPELVGYGTVDPSLQGAGGASMGGAGGNPAQRGAGNVNMGGAGPAPGGGMAGAGGAAAGGGSMMAGANGGTGTGWDENLDLGGLNPLDTDFGGQAQAGADAAYKGATQFMDGDFTQERDQARAQLVAQGLQPGSEAFESQMSRIERGQNAARQNAAFQAQGVGHQQSGDLLMRALQTRQQGVNERFGQTDRRLAGRGQDIGDRNTNRGMDINRDNIGLNATLANRRFGLDEDNQSFQQLMQLISSSRGGVNMPNFGGVAPLDVGGANSIASGNANAQANRDGTDRGNWAAILGGLAGKWL